MCDKRKARAMRPSVSFKTRTFFLELKKNSDFPLDSRLILVEVD